MIRTMTAAALAVLMATAFAYDASAQSAARQAFNEALDNCENMGNVDQRSECQNQAMQQYQEAREKEQQAK